jgi:hypothetical protein
VKVGFVRRCTSAAERVDMWLPNMTSGMNAFAKDAAAIENEALNARVPIEHEDEYVDNDDETAGDDVSSPAVKPRVGDDTVGESSHVVTAVALNVFVKLAGKPFLVITAARRRSRIC